jgi:hypothetical protein
MKILGRHVSNAVLGDHMVRVWLWVLGYPSVVGLRQSAQGMGLGLECIQGNVFVCNVVLIQ